MKVLLLTFNSGEIAIKLGSALAKKADVTLMVPDNLTGGLLDQVDPTIDFRPYRLPRLRQPIRQLYFLYKLFRQIHKINPDVIHVQIGHLWFNATLRFLRKYPLVITVHDPRDHVGDVKSRKTPQWVKDYGYRKSQRIIVHANEMKPILADLVDIPLDKISVVPLMEHGNSKLAPNFVEKKNTVLFFGRIWEYKGLEYLVRAEPLITAQVPDVKIVIAGEGESLNRYRKLMTNPDNFIIYNEYVSFERQAEIFREASVVVLPYIEATQSGVILTSYNFEKPVVATNVGGLHEQVDEGITGYLVEPRDVEALAEKVIYLLKNEEFRIQMGKNGHQKMVTEWSPDAIARKTIAVYDLAINDLK